MSFWTSLLTALWLIKCYNFPLGLGTHLFVKVYLDQ